MRSLKFRPTADNNQGAEVFPRTKPLPLPVSVPPFGPALKSALEAAGFPSSNAAAKRLGFNPATVSRYVARNLDPRWASFYYMLVGLNLPLESFFPPDSILEAARRIEASRAGGPPMEDAP